MVEKRSCKKEWFDDAEDDEDTERVEKWYDMSLDHDDSDDPYSFSDEIPWWHTIEGYEKACKDFLLCLADLTVCYINLVHEDTKNGFCYCPFNKRFHPYFSKMNVKYFIHDLKISKCGTKNKSGLMKSKSALVYHFQNSKGWHHKMMLVLIHKLFDDKQLGIIDESIVFLCK